MPSRRANGEGSAFWSASQGIWRAYWTLPNGTRRYASGKTAAEAVANRNRKRRDYEQGIREARRQTIGQLLDAWLEMKLATGCRPRTWAAYHSAIERNIKPHIGRILVTELEPQSLRDLYYKRLRKLAPGSIQRVHACISGSLKVALVDRIIPYNVAALVSPPPVQPYEARELTVAEVARILLAVQNHRHGPLWAYLAGTGCRFGEAAGLLWTAIELDERVVRIRKSAGAVPRQLREEDDPVIQLDDPKSKRSRRPIHIGDLVLKALEQQSRMVAELREAAGSAWNDEGLVFPDDSGRPLSNDRVLAAWHAMLKGIGLEGDGLKPIRQHDLRRAMATLVQDTGASVGVARDILGHATLATTSDIYTGRLEESGRRAIEALHAAIERAKTEQIQD